MHLSAGRLTRAAGGPAPRAAGAAGPSSCGASTTVLARHGAHRHVSCFLEFEDVHFDSVGRIAKKFAACGDLIEAVRIYTVVV